MASEKRAKNLGSEENRYQKLTTLIGEFGEEKLNDHIEKLKNEIQNSDAIFKDFLVNLLTKCISWIPGKQDIYSAVLIKIHENRPEFTEEVFQKLLSLFEELCTSGGSESLFRSKQILRFFSFCNLLGYLSTETLSDLLDSLLSLARNEQSEYFKVLLSHFFLYDGEGFPSALAVFQQVLNEKSDIMQKTVLQIYPGQSEDLLSRYRRALSTSHFLQNDRILKYCSRLSAPGWVEKMRLPPSLKPVFYTDLTIDLFNLAEDPVLFLKETEEISDLVFAFRHNLELLISKLEDKNLEFLVNTLLQLVLSLKTDDSEVVIFSSLAVKLSKVNSAGTLIEQKLLEGLNFLLSPSITASPVSLEKLSVFLAHFISNASFVWHWSSFLDKPLTQSSEFFIRKLLSKLVRLSYHEMIKVELPEALHKFLIPEPEPFLRFSEIEESVDSTDSQLIIDRINSKASTQAMKSLLTSKEICNSGDLLMMIFCESLFYQGAKSLQHITIYMERYLEILSGINPQMILASLFNVWEKSPQRIELLTGKLLAHKLVNSEDIVVFCLERLDKFEVDSFVVEWDLMQLAVDDSKNNKFGLVEMICVGIGRSSKRDKLWSFLRRNLKEISETQLGTLSALIRQDLSEDLKKLFSLVKT